MVGWIWLCAVEFIHICDIPGSWISVLLLVVSFFFYLYLFGHASVSLVHFCLCVWGNKNSDEEMDLVGPFYLLSIISKQAIPIFFWIFVGFDAHSFPVALFLFIGQSWGAGLWLKTVWEPFYLFPSPPEARSIRFLTVHIVMMPWTLFLLLSWVFRTGLTLRGCFGSYRYGWLPCDLYVVVTCFWEPKVKMFGCICDILIDILYILVRWGTESMCRSVLAYKILSSK